MSSIASGGTGAAGAPQQPSILELETTAATEVAKLTMKIVSDTSEVCFFLLDPNVRKYQSSANRPVLAPLIEVRVATNSDFGVSESWRTSYTNLLNLMPKEFRALFEQIMLLPKNEQPKDFQLLNSSLQTAAKLMEWLSAASVPITAESFEANRMGENIARPYIALHCLIKDSEIFFGGIQSYLASVGPNDPNFDRLSGYTGALTPLFDDLKAAAEMLQDPSTEKEARTLLSSTAAKLSALEGQFDRLYGGDQLLMLGQTIHAAKTTAQALSMEQPGSAALVITLSLVTSGNKPSESSLGVLGNNLSTISEALTSGIQQATGSKLSSGSAALLNNLSTVAFATLLLLGDLHYDALSASQKGTGAKVASDTNFSYGLLLNMLVDSKALSSISNSILQASEIKGSASSATATLLATGMLLSLIFASVSGQNLSSSEQLFKGQNPAFKEAIDAANQLVSDGLLAGTLSGENAEHLQVYLQQAAIALEQEDTEGFMSALNSSLELTGATTDGFVDDLKDSKTIAQNFQQGVADSASALANNCTGIHVAA